MGRKKILIISIGFYPLITPRSFRTTELAKSLAQLGHDVTVITKRDNTVHDQFEKQYNIKVKDMGSVYMDAYSVNNQSLIQKSILKLLFITGLSNFLYFPYIMYYSKVKKILLQESIVYDSIISIASPHSIHWGVAAAMKHKKITKNWIADCGDPFMMNPFTKRPQFFKNFEKDFCQNADYITVPLEKAKDAYYPEFREKIKVIPQGFDFEEDRKKIKEYKKNLIPTFAYSGVFYENMRDPSALFDYLINSSIDFRFIIYTSSYKMVQPYAEMSNGRIIVRPYIPRDELLIALSQMDFLININNKGNVQSPSKIIDYYITKRPILSLNSNEVDKDILEDFLNGDYNNRLIIHNIEQYDINNVAQSFVSLMNERN